VLESLLPQTRDLLLGEVSQSGGRKVAGGRIDNVVVKRVTKREKLRDSDRLLATYCILKCFLCVLGSRSLNFRALLAK
jgi:hypothetical protein